MESKRKEFLIAQSLELNAGSDRLNLKKNSKYKNINPKIIYDRIIYLSMGWVLGVLTLYFFGR